MVLRFPERLLVGGHKAIAASAIGVAGMAVYRIGGLLMAKFAWSFWASGRICRQIRK